MFILNRHEAQPVIPGQQSGTWNDAFGRLLNIVASQG